MHWSHRYCNVQSKRTLFRFEATIQSYIYKQFPSVGSRATSYTPTGTILSLCGLHSKAQHLEQLFVYCQRWLIRRIFFFSFSCTPVMGVLLICTKEGAQRQHIVVLFSRVGTKSTFLGDFNPIKSTFHQEKRSNRSEKTDTSAKTKTLVTYLTRSSLLRTFHM